MGVGGGGGWVGPVKVSRDNKMVNDGKRYMLEQQQRYKYMAYPHTFPAGNEEDSILFEDFTIRCVLRRYNDENMEGGGGGGRIVKTVLGSLPIVGWRTPWSSARTRYCRNWP